MSKTAFMKNYFAQGIEALTKSTNIFAAQVEAKLALSMIDLHAQSKLGDGLFDLIFDFNSFLQLHTDAMNLKLQYQI